MPEGAARERLAATNLNAGQRQAAWLMAGTADRIVAVQGFAGTGKSHMLETAKAIIEEARRSIYRLLAGDEPKQEAGTED